MKCDKCSKKATVHLTEIVDGKVMEMHLCEDCAQEQSQSMEQQFGLADLLAGLTDFGKHVPDVKKSVLACEDCGLTYEEFRKFGRFGCAQCYLAFKPQLDNLFKKIHGSSAHLGKQPEHLVEFGEGAEAPVIDDGIDDEPVELSLEDEVALLRAKLQKAIAREDFESAAKFRDKIHELEGKG